MHPHLHTTLPLTTTTIIMFSPITLLSFALLALIPSAIARPATSRRAANQRKCKAPVEPSCTKFATGVLSADVNGACLA